MVLLQNAYIDALNTYENSLDAEYKKGNGVFYTDYTLAERMLNDLKVDKSAVIMDPCCGAGVFIYVAYKQGFSNLFGIDQDKGAVAFCQSHLPFASFSSCDSIGLKADVLMKKIGLDSQPDVIIGNPPYVPITAEDPLDAEYLFIRHVTKSGNNLFVAALMRALQIVKTDGVVSYIIPKNFLHVHSYSTFRRELLKDKTIMTIVDLGAHFKNVRGEQIVITIKNKKPSKNHKITMKKFSSNRFVKMTSIAQNFFSDEFLLFNCDEDQSTYRKLSSLYQTLNDLCNGYVGRGKSQSPHAITGKDIRKFGYKTHEIPKEGNQLFIQNIYSAEAGVIAAFGGNLEAAQTVTVFTDGDADMCRYVLGILHSRICNLFLYKYCFNYSKLTMHTDAKYLKKIPLPSRDLQEQYFDDILKLVSLLESSDYMGVDWFNYLEELNRIVYKAYGIDENEANYIDSEVKRIQSKRWISDGQF